jgi:NitT/TauT family transport system permease protein
MPMIDLASTSKQYSEWLARRARMRRVVKGWRLAILVAALGLWELLPRLRFVNPMLTSYPSAICTTFFQLTRASPSIFSHAIATISSTLLGFGVSMGLGVAVASALWWWDTLYQVVDPYLVIVNAMPKVAFVPMFYLWLGPTLSIQGISVAISMFVAILMIHAGFVAVDPAKICLGRALGATRQQIFRKVIYPASVPALVATSKITVGLSLVGTVVGEFQSAAVGLGYLIQYGSQTFKLDIVLVSVAILAVVSAGMYWLIARLEAAVLRRGWNRLA